MADLIDRHALIELFDWWEHEYDEIDSYIKNMRQDALTLPTTEERLPSAEQTSAQPEIIRCKECEHWDTSWENDFAPNYQYCPLVDGVRRGDFYCADAERRTDE